MKPIASRTAPAITSRRAASPVTRSSSEKRRKRLALSEPAAPTADSGIAAAPPPSAITSGSAKSAPHDRHLIASRGFCVRHSGQATQAISHLHVAGEEGVDGLVPEAGVLRAQDPVVLVRKDEELGVDAVHLERLEEEESLADRDAVVLLAVDDQGG